VISPADRRVVCHTPFTAGLADSTVCDIWIGRCAIVVDELTLNQVSL
jgi:hypothetical protein